MTLSVVLLAEPDHIEGLGVVLVMRLKSAPTINADYAVAALEATLPQGMHDRSARLFFGRITRPSSASSIRSPDGLKSSRT
jgi:hypothetical protein